MKTSKKINNASLLSLLRLVIDGDSCKEEQISDWQSVYAIAREQAVIGVVLYAIQQLETSMRPPRKMLLSWIGTVERIKNHSLKLDDALASIVSEFRSYGIECLVVKGQVIACEYGDEVRSMRQPGDIDLFFDKNNWYKVEQWLEKKKIPFSRSAAEKHIEIDYKGAHVELHYHLKTFSSHKAQAYWENDFEGRAMANVREVIVNDVPVKTLGVTDSLAYLLVHAHTHLLTEGIGLRQLMDMTFFIRNHSEEIDFGRLKCILENIGHFRAFKAFFALMVKSFCLSKELVPYALNSKDYVYADRIMGEVWKGGNFGKNNNLDGVNPGLLHSLNTAILVFKHSWKFYRLAPAEARGYWWNKIFWRMKRE